MINLEHTYKQEWDASYSRGENNILYPQVEVIRFLNRYICARNNDGTVTNLIDKNQRLRGLDFACGVGTHCTVLKDFEIDGYGVDISEKAITIAIKNGEIKGIPKERFTVLSGKKQILPFDDNYFNFAIAESCLDSMPYVVACNYANELKRVSRNYIYASFIGHDPSIIKGEFIVETEHEKGTVQTIFDEIKIANLFDLEPNQFSYLNKIEQIDCRSGKIIGCRYYCVIKTS